MTRETRKHPVRLALLAALAFAAFGCQREQARSEPPQTTESQVAAAPAPAPVPAPPPAAAPATGTEPPTVTERHDVEQPPRSVVPPPAPPAPEAAAPGARERQLAERERRLARRQAELQAREERLRQREAETEAPAPAPAPSVEEPAPAAPAPEPEPLPAPTPPRPEPVTVPAGTQLGVQLSGTLSSAANKVGDTFRTRVDQDVYEGDQLAIPAGSEIVGEVTQAQPLQKKIGGKAVLGLRFTDLILPSGETIPIHASLKQEGENKGKRDAATIGGATAGGAILGRILSGGGGKGTLIGAIIGAAAGAAIAANRPGQEVVIPEGTVLGIVFDQPVELHRPR